MDPRTESIKQEVEETLEDMAAKMEQIEERVVGTARETVEQVREKLDVRYMVAQRPWTMLGVSVATGFVVGSIRRSRAGRDESRDSNRRARRAGPRPRRAAPRMFQYEHSQDPYRHVDEGYQPGTAQGLSEGLLRGLSQEHRRRWGEAGRADEGYRERAMEREEEDYERPARQLVRRSISQARQRAPGFMDTLRDQFGDDLEALKRAAVAAAGNSLLGILQKNVPQLAEEFDRARHELEQQRDDSPLRGEQRPRGEQRMGSQARYQGENRYQAPEARYGTENRYQSPEEQVGQYQARYGAEAQGAESEQGSAVPGGEQYEAEGFPGAPGHKSHN